MSDHWNELLPFYAAVKEGSTDTGPPHVEIEGTTLDDGRQVYCYLVPRYKDDEFRTLEGYHRCYDRAQRLCELLNREIASAGLVAFRPGTVLPRRRQVGEPPA